MNYKFDKCYCLHCVESEDRLEHCINEFNRVGLDVEMHEICTSPVDTIIGEKMDALHTSFYDNKLSQNKDVYGRVFSCAYNHYQIVKKSYLKGYNNVLVMEDDIQFCKNLPLIKNTFENIPSDYELLKFHHTLKRFYETDSDQQIFVKQPPSYYMVRSTLCYALSRAGMKKVIDDVETDCLKIADLQHQVFEYITHATIPICTISGHQSLILHA